MRKKNKKICYKTDIKGKIKIELTIAINIKIKDNIKGTIKSNIELFYLIEQTERSSENLF